MTKKWGELPERAVSCRYFVKFKNNTIYCKLLDRWISPGYCLICPDYHRKET